MANRKIPSPVQFLKDLFSTPPAVTQELLNEMERHQREIERLSAELQQRLQIEKIDLEVVETEITEMLILGSPVEPGRLTVVVAPNGRLALSREEGK